MTGEVVKPGVCYAPPPGRTYWSCRAMHHSLRACYRWLTSARCTYSRGHSGDWLPALWSTYLTRSTWCQLPIVIYSLWLLHTTPFIALPDKLVTTDGSTTSAHTKLIGISFLPATCTRFESSWILQKNIELGRPPPIWLLLLMIIWYYKYCYIYIANSEFHLN